MQLLRKRLTLVADEIRALSQAICLRTMSLEFRYHTGLKSRSRISSRSDSGLQSWHDRIGIVAARTCRVSGTRNQDPLALEIPTMPVEESFVETKVFVLPMGKLFVQYIRSRFHTNSPEGDEWRVTRVDTIFIPPWFLSNTMIRAHIESSHSSTHCVRPGPTYSLQPILINQNPELLKALYMCDIPQLRNLFSTSRARPTDMIMDYDSGDAVTLLEVRLVVINYRRRLRLLIRQPYRGSWVSHKTLK